MEISELVNCTIGCEKGKMIRETEKDKKMIRRLVSLGKNDETGEHPHARTHTVFNGSALDH